MSMYKTSLPDAKERMSESIPSFMDYRQKQVAVPCENSRYFISPNNGSVFSSTATTGSLMRFNLSAGGGGIHLNTQETSLVFTIQNSSSNSITLDGSGLACIDQIDVYFGSSHLSTFGGYANCINTLTDFTSLGHHFNRGVADYDVTGGSATVYASSNINNALNGRNGVTIAGGSSYTVSVPIVNFLGTLALKSIPLGQLRDNITMEIRTAGFNDWGVLSADTASGLSIINPRLWITTMRISGDTEMALINALPNRTIQVPCFDVQNFSTNVQADVGSFSYQIPVRCSSVTTILVTMRDSESQGNRSARGLARNHANIDSYRFRCGSQVLPSTFIDCSRTSTANNSAEARMELQRALSQLSVVETASWVPTALYTKEGSDSTTNKYKLTAGEYGAFAFALSLSAFQMAELLSDGFNSKNAYITCDVKFRTATSPALRVDFYVFNEMLLTVEGGVMSYAN